MILVTLYGADRILAHYNITQARDQILIVFSIFYVNFMFFVLIVSTLRSLFG